jgi:hypothetical protein
MSNFYGFERVTFWHQVGWTGNIAGKVVTDERYFIRRKANSGICVNGCYRTIASKRGIRIWKWCLDAPRYGDIDMALDKHLLFW